MWEPGARKICSTLSDLDFDVDDITTWRSLTPFYEREQGDGCRAAS